MNSLSILLVAGLMDPGFENTATKSYHDYFRVTRNKKNEFFAHHAGKRLKILGQIHTHPSSKRGAWCWTKSNHFLGSGDFNFAMVMQPFPPPPPPPPPYTIGPK